MARKGRRRTVAGPRSLLLRAGLPVFTLALAIEVIDKGRVLHRPLADDVIHYFAETAYQLAKRTLTIQRADIGGGTKSATAEGVFYITNVPFSDAALRHQWAVGVVTSVIEHLCTSTAFYVRVHFALELAEPGGRSTRSVWEFGLGPHPTGVAGAISGLHPVRALMHGFD